MLVEILDIGLESLVCGSCVLWRCVGTQQVRWSRGSDQACRTSGRRPNEATSLMGTRALTAHVQSNESIFQEQE